MNRSESTTGARRKVAVVYTHFPHYRAPVFDALTGSQAFDFEFFYDCKGIDRTIENGEVGANHHHLKVTKIGPLLWQPGAVALAFRSDFDDFVFLGNPYILSTWVASAFARLRRKRVYYWTHGWLSNESGPKAIIRNAFYRIGNGLMLYSERSRGIGLQKGFAAARLHVVNNSLDYEEISSAREAVQSADYEGAPLETEYGYFLTVGRLVPELGLDLALDAVWLLKKTGGQSYTLAVVGDGPSRARLEARAKELGIDVRFLGAIYDETKLAEMFTNAIAVVSPGKVGLLAIHSLGYGAPVITHDNFDTQMPEVEALEEGLTGAFFKYGDARSLAEKLAQMGAQDWDTAQDGAPSLRATVRVRAVARIEAGYTPEAQRKLIEAALDAGQKGDNP